MLQISKNIINLRDFIIISPENGFAFGESSGHRNVTLSPSFHFATFLLIKIECSNMIHNEVSVHRSKYCISSSFKYKAVTIPYINLVYKSSPRNCQNVTFSSDCSICITICVCQIQATDRRKIIATQITRDSHLEHSYEIETFHQTDNHNLFEINTYCNDVSKSLS